MNYRKLTSGDKETFDRDGYLLVPSFFIKEEIDKLYGIAKDDVVIKKKSV